MNYIKTNLILNHPLSFWANFESGERFFWYDSAQNQLIIGCERLEAIEAPNASYPYAFYTQSFFNQIKGKLWEDFGGETLVFKHYFVKNNHESYMLSVDGTPEIKEGKFPLITHHVTEKSSDFESWEMLFNKIQENFAQHRSEKIVASREIEFTSDTGFNIESILQKLIANNPGCFIFAYQKGEKIFLGASPEILVQKQEEKILSFALAGTMPRLPLNDTALLHDSKNLHEHSIVVKKIRQSLLERAKRVVVGQTGIMTLKNVYHLKTVLTADNEDGSLIDWAKHLHPTPALGGEPKDEALNFLRKYETYERGLYAAPIGLIDAKGNGTIVVGIRSALIEENTLHAYAGCGIVPSSDCLDEFNETKIKLKTILEAL